MNSKFESLLSSFRRRWQRGILFQTSLRVAGLLLCTYAAYSLLDFLLGLESETRFIINGIIAVGTAGAALRWIIAVIAYSLRDAAIDADRVSSNKRRAILSALELLENSRHSNSQSGYLVEQAVMRASAELEKIPNHLAFPKRAVILQARTFAIQAVLFSAAVALQSPGAAIVWDRILHPSLDIPPFSGLVFKISPEAPRIPYGGDATINVEISGGKVRSQVVFITRSGTSEHRTTCFQEGQGRYAQKMEKVVQPFEFAFATGRARSHWHKVDLVLQPRVSQALVTISAPSYTGQPDRTSVAGKLPLTSVVGSSATLSITSNRPLSGGSISIRPREESASSASVVDAVKTGPNTVSFSWPMRESADLDVTIRDLRGTPNQEPFRLVQQVVPDLPPQAVITEPGAYALATPDSTLALAGYAEDDLGLARVDIVRTVVGFRDRPMRLGPGSPMRRMDFSSEIDMRKLGVAPGQTLEFYLEATDTNPSLMGIGSSAVVRIDIISTENYAKMIRDRTTLEEFLSRYRVLTEHLAALRDTISQLEDKAYSGTEADKDRLIKDAREQAQKSEDLFKKMAADFPAFDSDTALSKTASDIASKISSVKKQLDTLQAGSTNLGGVARDLLSELGGADQQMKEQNRSAQEIAAVSRVMESAAEFQKIILQQTEIERQMNLATQNRDRRMLESLGERQIQIRAALLSCTSDLAERANKLPSGYEQLAASTREFLDKLEPLKVPDDMAAGTTASKNQNFSEAARMSSIALEKLRRLLSQCSGMGGMCNGKVSFKVPDPLMPTVNQMLQSLLARSLGSGNDGAQGSGSMGEGGSASGNSMGGQSLLNTPVFGPSRLSFGTNSNSQSGNGGRSGTGRLASGNVDASAQMKAAQPEPAKQTGLPIENIPEQYRAAVKQYFSQPEDKK